MAQSESEQSISEILVESPTDPMVPLIENTPPGHNQNTQQGTEDMNVNYEYL